MSFDLHLAPASDFLNWNDQQWEEYFSRDPFPEGIQLGGSAYVSLVLEAISHNLEDDRPASKYPLLMRIDTEERVGWYRDEVERLLQEIESVKADLAALPITRETLKCSTDEDVQRRIRDFKDHHCDRPLRNLYELNFWFIDGFEAMARKALSSGQGLTVCY
jgi:hypothetical protein